MHEDMGLYGMCTGTEAQVSPFSLLLTRHPSSSSGLACERSSVACVSAEGREITIVIASMLAQNVHGEDKNNVLMFPITPEVK